MDIMMELDGDDLNSLRLRFLEENDNSLDLQQFIDEMLMRLPQRAESEQGILYIIKLNSFISYKIKRFICTN